MSEHQQSGDASDQARQAGHCGDDPGRVEPVDALRAAEPERFESWWSTGSRLDVVTAPGLAVATLDECKTKL